MRQVLFRLPDWIPIVGGMPLYAYGMMLGLSFILGCWITLVLSSRDGFDRRVVRLILASAVAGAIIGARLVFVTANLSMIHSVADLFRITSGGLVAQGGMLGGIVGALVACRACRVDFWSFSDHAAPTLALGLALTRIGCFLNGCCFGRVTDSCLGVTFPLGSPAYEHHLEEGLLSVGAGTSLPVHATQLYSSVNGLLGLVLLLWVYRNRRFAGQVLLTFLIWYGVTRCVLELFRDDPQRGTVFALSTSQFTSLLAVVVGIGLYWWRARSSALPAS